LGKLSRDTGHNRLPEPPDRITGTTRPLSAATVSDEVGTGEITFMADRIRIV
jgi:hypothetical protein